MLKISADEQPLCAESSAALLWAMGNEVRIRILVVLVKQEISVGRLCELIGMTHSALSQHLSKLRQARLVCTRRAGTTVYYRCESRAVRQILGTLSSLVEAGVLTKSQAARPETRRSIRSQGK